MIRARLKSNMTHQIKYLLAFLSIVIQVGACNTDQLETKKEPTTDGPIQLHPENPHYFLYKGKPLALITSAEHYGALLNLDFD